MPMSGHDDCSQGVVLKYYFPKAQLLLSVESTDVKKTSVVVELCSLFPGIPRTSSYAWDIYRKRQPHGLHQHFRNHL